MPTLLMWNVVVDEGNIERDGSNRFATVLVEEKCQV